MFVFTTDQIRALYVISSNTAGALVAIDERPGWLHVRLTWPGGEFAEVAVMTPGNSVRRLDWRGRPADPIAPDLVRTLRS